MSAHASAVPVVENSLTGAGRKTMSHKAVVELFGTDRCHGTQFCKIALDARGVDFVFRNLDTDAWIEDVLRGANASTHGRFPLLVIGDTRLVSPSLTELDRALERHAIVPMKLYHCAEQRRYFMNMQKGEAFISYRDVDGVRSLEHTFVPTLSRRRGIGKNLVAATLMRLCRDGYKTRFRCEFINHMARRIRDEAALYLQNSQRAQVRLNTEHQQESV